MKLFVYMLLALEAVLAGFALMGTIASNLVVLLLAGNSVVLIWAATRLRRKPSCCR